MSNVLLNELITEAETVTWSSMLCEIPSEVMDHVSQYLKEHDLGELVEIRRASNHPDDSHLYHVIAKKENTSKLFHDGEYSYSCFTSWNENTQSLNFGHYNMERLEDARAVSDEFFHDMNDKEDEV